MNKRALVLGALMLMLGATPALAANVTGDGTLVGSSSNDNLVAGNANDTVWGLGGSDNITAGNGNDNIYAGGTCLSTVKSGDYRNGLSTDSCEQGNQGGNQGNNDNIQAGNGNNSVYGGAGRDTISVGSGTNYIYGGPVGDIIYAGPSKSMGSDTVYLDYNNTSSSYTGSTVYVSNGRDTVFAQNKVADTIVCAPNNQTTVYADAIDWTKGCAHVYHPAMAAAVRRRSAHHARTVHRARTRKATHRA